MLIFISKTNTLIALIQISFNLGEMLNQIPNHGRFFPLKFAVVNKAMMQQRNALHRQRWMNSLTSIQFK